MAAHTKFSGMKHIYVFKHDVKTHCDLQLPFSNHVFPHCQRYLDDKIDDDSTLSFIRVHQSNEAEIPGYWVYHFMVLRFNPVH